jgi:hypothetical protein
MNEQSVSDLLYVGTIHVDVGYDFDVPTAETVDMLGAMELGGKIRVDLARYPFGDDYLYEDDPPLGSVGMWKMLLTQMRDMLARCFLFGEMRVLSSERLRWAVEEEEEEDAKNLDRAVTELGEEYFKITPGLGLETLKGRARDDRDFTDGLYRLGRLMQEEGLRRGLNREERKRMPLKDYMSGGPDPTTRKPEEKQGG